MSLRDKALEDKLNNFVSEIELFNPSNDEMRYLEDLFRIKVDPFWNPIDSLHEAFCMNYLEVVKKLVNRFPELQTSDNIQLSCEFAAQYNNSIDIPEFMFSLGIEFDVELLKSIANKYEREDILQLLN